MQFLDDGVKCALQYNLKTLMTTEIHNNQTILAELNSDILQNTINAQLGLGEKYLPIDGFRPCVQRILNSVAYDFDCHRDKAVMAALMTVAGTVGKKATLVSGKYRNHPQLYGVLVDRPGGVKSIVNNYFLRPLEYLNRNAKDRWNRKKRELLLDDPNAEVPLPSIYMTKDVTPERLKQLLVSSKTGIFEFHDELAGMFADFGKYSKTGSSDMEMRLSLYNGQVEAPDRKGDDEFLIEPEETSYSLYGTIQYKTLQRYFKPIVERENGGFDRFLFVECPSRKMRYSSIAENFTHDPEEWKTIIYDLDKVPDGREYFLSQGAIERYDKFFNEIIDKLNADPEGADFLTQTLRRAGQNCLRLSLVIHLLNDWHEVEITPEEMDMAVRMMRVFCKNAEICYHKIYEEDKKKEEKKPTITLSNQVRQFYMLMSMQGKTAADINQSALAKMFGCSQAYINKVKSALIREGLIEAGESRRGRREETKFFDVNDVMNVDAEDVVEESEVIDNVAETGVIEDADDVEYAEEKDVEAETGAVEESEDVEYEPEAPVYTQDEIHSSHVETTAVDFESTGMKWKIPPAESETADKVKYIKEQANQVREQAKDVQPRTVEVVERSEYHSDDGDYRSYNDDNHVDNSGGTIDKRSSDPHDTSPTSKPK